MGHLKSASVVHLSEAQTKLFELHLARMSSYCEKVVQTITLTQRFLHCTEPSIEQQGDSTKTWQADAMAPAQHTQAERRRQKLLKLNDSELLTMLSAAQQEAEAEADWRGIDICVAGRKIGAPLAGISHAQEPATVTHGGCNGSACSTTSRSDLLDAAGSPLRRPPPTGAVSLDHEQAIQLLGNAIAVRAAPNSRELAAASEELAQRLVPVNQQRSCGTVPSFACACLPIELPPAEPSGAAESMPKLDHASAALLQDRDLQSCKESRARGQTSRVKDTVGTEVSSVFELEGNAEDRV